MKSSTSEINYSNYVNMLTYTRHILLFYFIFIFFYYFIILYSSRRKFFSAFYPIQACPSSGGQARSSRQPLFCSARGPTFLVVVVPGQMTLFYMFLVGGYIWRNPREHGGEHANRKAHIICSISIIIIILYITANKTCFCWQSSRLESSE